MRLGQRSNASIISQYIEFPAVGIVRDSASESLNRATIRQSTDAEKISRIFFTLVSDELV